MYRDTVSHLLYDSSSKRTKSHNPHSHVHPSHSSFSSLGAASLAGITLSGLPPSWLKTGWSLPVTRSSAVLVACPDPLVALREYRPLLALVTAGIINLARPSLKVICTPGRVEVEITWPSRNQLTSGTGEPGRQAVIFMLEWTRSSALSFPIIARLRTSLSKLARVEPHLVIVAA